VDSLVTLAVATAVLVAVPGPNAALIVGDSLARGFRKGAVTVLGTTSGVALQLSLVVLGLVAAIDLAANALDWIRWAGVGYLLWLGIRTYREASSQTARTAASAAMFWRGCLVAAVNPKTLLFNAAFLPQFVAPGGGIAGHPASVAAVYLGVLLVGDLLWAAFASSARRLTVHSEVAGRRLAGGVLVLAGIGLGLARRGN
jgi:threonine/homoserine/homoserine lactone efflux protein